MRAFIVLILVALTASAHAAPAKTQFVYSISRAGEVIGETQETLTLDGDRYHLESKTTPKGVAAIFLKGNVVLISQGGFSDKGFRPESFEHQRHDKPNKSASARFDWAAKTATHLYEGKNDSETLPEAMQDRLSVLYQLRYWPPKQATFSIPVSTGRKIETQLFKRKGEETLTLPLGKVKAVRYARDRTPDDDGISVWFSDKWVAPVKILIEGKKGGKTEQVLQRVKNEP